MPRHDPIPRRRQADRQRASDAWDQYKKTMRWMLLASAATVALSLLYLKQAGGPMPLHMVIATIAGVGLTMVVGTALMSLVFLSNRSGHDDEAGRGDVDDDDDRQA